MERESNRKYKIKNIIIQILILLIIFGTVYMIQNAITKKEREGNYYSVVATFTNAQEKDKVLEKIAKDDRKYDLVDVGLFKKEYMIYDEKEITEEEAHSMEEKLKELDEKVHLSNPVYHPMPKKGVNMKENILYLIAIIAVTILSMNVFEKDEEDIRK